MIKSKFLCSLFNNDSIYAQDSKKFDNWHIYKARLKGSPGKDLKQSHRVRHHVSEINGDVASRMLLLVVPRQVVDVVGEVSEVHESVGADIMPESMRRLSTALIVARESVTHVVHDIVVLIEARQMIGELVDRRSEIDTQHKDRFLVEEVSRKGLLLPHEGVPNLDEDGHELTEEVDRLRDRQLEVARRLLKLRHVGVYNKSGGSTRHESIAETNDSPVGELPREDVGEDRGDISSVQGEVILFVVSLEEVLSPVVLGLSIAHASHVTRDLSGSEVSRLLAQLSKD